MKRKEMENGANCVEFNLKDFSPHERSRYIQFIYADKFKNEFIVYMWMVINQLGEDDENFKNALSIIRGQEKNANKVANKEERDEKLKQAYQTVYKKIKDNKILSKNDRTKEFRKIYSKKYNIFLADDQKDYLCDDVIAAFEDLFFNKGKDVKEKEVGNGKGTRALRQKPMFSKKKDGTINNKKQGSASIIFKNGKAYFRIWDLRPEALKHIFDVWDEEKQTFNTPTGQCPNHKYVEFEIYCNETDDLQKQLMSNMYLGYTKLVRYWKKGKYRYRVQINFEETSPIVKEIDINNNHIIGVDWGTETCAIVRDDGFQEIIELTPDSPRVTERIKELDRYMDNSRRATNPNFYNEDGTIKYTKKEMKELKLKYSYSKRYYKARDERREGYRKLRETRKLNNLTMVKHKIIPLGDFFHTEFNPFNAWGMKGCRMAKKTAEKFLTNNRKDYTKQIHDRAPRNGRCKIKVNMRTKRNVLWKN